MPGKVNPVIPEVVNQVCFDVIGGDVTVTLAAEAGQLQLNVFEPIIAYRLLQSLDTLKNSCVVLRQRCVGGITANPARMRQFVEQSIGIVTALVPALGYDTATAVAKEALEGWLEAHLVEGPRRVPRAPRKNHRVPRGAQSIVVTVDPILAAKVALRRARRLR